MKYTIAFIDNRDNVEVIGDAFENDTVWFPVKKNGVWVYAVKRDHILSVTREVVSGEAD